MSLGGTAERLLCCEPQPGGGGYRTLVESPRMKISALIVDDEQPARDELAFLLSGSAAEPRAWAAFPLCGRKVGIPQTWD